MLYQPTNIIPSSFAGPGNDLIDATDGMTVSWQVNGDSAMTGYALTICRNDAASTELYASGTVVLSAPFYGRDGNGNVQRYSVPLSAAALSASGIVNGYENGYKLTIRQYWGANSYIDQTSASFFLAQDKPIVSITTTEIHGAVGTLEGTCVQAQQTPLYWVRWTATEESSGALAFDSGRLFTQKLAYEFDGWLDGTTYSVTLEYQMQNGYEGTESATVETEFYQIANLVVQRGTEAGMSADCGGVLVRYPYPTKCSLPQTGVVTESVSFNDETGRYAVSVTEDGPFWWYQYGLVNINGAVGVSWSLAATSGADSRTFFLLRCRLNNEDGLFVTLADFSGGICVVRFLWTDEDFDPMTDSLNGSKVRWSRLWPVGDTTGNGEFYSFVLNNPSNGGYVDFSLTYTDADGTNTLSAKDAFYGSTPDDPFETNEITRCSIYIEKGQTQALFGIYEPVGTIEVCYWCVEANRYSVAELSVIRSNSGQPPDETPNTLFFTTDEWMPPYGAGTVNGGVTIQTIDRLEIYRRDGDEPIYHHIRSITLSDIEDAAYDYNAFIDYGVKNGVPYQYNLYFTRYYETDGTVHYAPAMESSAITPCFWHWLLITAEGPDDSGQYHADTIYRFALNVENGPMSNNNAPNILQNFTRYPTRQGVAPNYRSGSLTAYIGTVDETQNVYTDTAAQAQAIFALSTDGKPKFLKSRKGEIWRVDTSSATTLTLGDKYREQPYSATLNWVEVGSAENTAIVMLPTDEGWTG